MIERFYGNAAAAGTLQQMLASGRLTQTILLSGPEGIGKATLARRFASLVLSGGRTSLDHRIERDDLSLPDNTAVATEREKLAADKRNDDPLLFSSHPDFVTFPPDGPMRQISIAQMRLLKERSQLRPLHGNRRVFLIDRLDRANEQAANSLLKVLEEPPEHLVILMTAENPYDLLPTIRSRSVMLALSRLPDEEMKQFAAERNLDQAERRLALAGGSPGLALSMDLDAYDKRRTAMMALLRVGAGEMPFTAWTRFSESIGASKTEKLENYLRVLYLLLEDVAFVMSGHPDVRNTDIRAELDAVAGRVTFDWVRTAVARADELVMLSRRNIQKSLALDAMVLALRAGR
ncbi:MAG: AAA family ATPase [Acidobacteria bacterium]|nr:AAA family ATPase [Acidobacteriota bacterium]